MKQFFRTILLSSVIVFSISSVATSGDVDGSLINAPNDRMASVEEYNKELEKDYGGVSGVFAVRSGMYDVFVIIMLLIAYMLRRLKKHRDLIYFLDGKPELINPNVPIHEQVDLLPYDRNYEFPKEKLARGKLLGSGAFGCVKEAIAHGSIGGEKGKKVAVKMINARAGKEELRALMLELKILIHVGRHLNVICLLGAVTEKISKCELMVIVEHCQFGSLKVFLVEHRRFFVDQINHANDKIDFDIVEKNAEGSLNDESLRSSSSLSSGRSTSTTADKPNISGYKIVDECLSSSSSSASSSGSKTNTTAEDTNISGYKMMSNSNTLSEQNVSQTVSEYVPLTKLATPLRPASTLDLLLWSYQIARGMEYLASMNVMHGDLAARNILLCEGNVVKICDFGLARTMCQKDYYRKNAKNEVKLPYKWLAPESEQTLVFRTFSDVWSYGILLWELFSLGDEPYKDIESCEDLFSELNDGYRMPQPDYATERIHWTMQSCWNSEPRLRPKFDQLAQIFSDILGTERIKYFYEINASELAANDLEHSLMDGMKEIIAEQ